VMAELSVFTLNLDEPVVRPFLAISAPDVGPAQVTSLRARARSWLYR
jgi:hypothetical protein